MAYVQYNGSEGKCLSDCCCGKTLASYWCTEDWRYPTV